MLTSCTLTHWATAKMPSRCTKMSLSMDRFPTPSSLPQKFKSETLNSSMKEIIFKSCQFESINSFDEIIQYIF